MATVQWKQLSRNIEGDGYFTGSLGISGSFQTSGSLKVDGTTTLRAFESGSSLIVKGQLEVLNSQVASVVNKARVRLENLGSIGDRDDNNTLDLGGLF